jgi:uncharacterized membrane protein
MTQPEPQHMAGRGDDVGRGPESAARGPGDGTDSGAPETAPMHWPGSRRYSKDAWEVWMRRAGHMAMLSREGMPVPAWLRNTRGERRWPITLSVIAAIVLQVLLPPDFTKPLPPFLIAILEGVLLVGLTIADPFRVERSGKLMRTATIALIVLITLANAVSAILLIRAILDGKTGSAAGPLFATGASIWATNVIAFALWYWEFDRGGPVVRTRGTSQHPDFLFPQMAVPELAGPDWEPQFVDYLYLGFTNATAFSPTDVMPLARWTKLTMLVQSSLSLGIGALVIARAVNILKA